MAMVSRLLEPKLMTDEALGAHEDASRTTGYGRPKSAEVANRAASINEVLNKVCLRACPEEVCLQPCPAHPSPLAVLRQVSEYHGVSEQFQKEYEQSSKDVAVAGTRLAHMRRHSGEIDPASSYAPTKSKPFRWEPHIDEEVRAAYRAAAEQAITLADSLPSNQTSGRGVIGVLQDQLEAERMRAHHMQVCRTALPGGMRPSLQPVALIPGSRLKAHAHLPDCHAGAT
jgi:hypothetical protein